MEYSARERLMRALNFEPVDMIPAPHPYLWSQGQFGRPFLEDPTVSQDKKELLIRELGLNRPAVSLFMYGPDVYKNGWDQWGVYWEKILDTYHPIVEWDDLLTYEFPRAQFGLLPEDQIARRRKEGQTVVFGGAWPIITFERYRALRGFENSLTDPILHPDNCHDLISRIEDYNAALIQRFVELGCDIVGFADDWGSNQGTLMSPEMWRRFYKPSYKRYCDLIHAGGAKSWMHSDGAITAILPDLVEVGLDMLEPVQAECMDIRQVAKDYAGRLVICGGLDSRLVGLGTYESVRQHVAEAIEVWSGFRGGMVGTAVNYLLPSIDVALALYHAFRRAPW